MQNIWANILSSDVHSQLQFYAPMKRLSGFSVGMQCYIVERDVAVVNGV